MQYPQVELSGKKIIVLSGFEGRAEKSDTVSLCEKWKLENAVRQNSDAVAFAYFKGRWVPVA